MPSVARRRRTVSYPISIQHISNILKTQAEEESSEEDRGHTTQRNRRRAQPSSDEEEEDVEGGEDEMDVDARSDAQDQVVKKMVRYALACEYQRMPIRRSGITERGMPCKIYYWCWC